MKRYPLPWPHGSGYWDTDTSTQTKQTGSPPICDMACTYVLDIQMPEDHTIGGSPASGIHHGSLRPRVSRSREMYTGLTPKAQRSGKSTGKRQKEEEKHWPNTGPYDFS